MCDIEQGEEKVRCYVVIKPHKVKLAIVILFLLSIYIDASPDDSALAASKAASAAQKCESPEGCSTTSCFDTTHLCEIDKLIKFVNQSYHPSQVKWAETELDLATFNTSKVSRRIRYMAARHSAVSGGAILLQLHCSVLDEARGLFLTTLFSGWQKIVVLIPRIWMGWHWAQSQPDRLEVQHFCSLLHSYGLSLSF